MPTDGCLEEALARLKEGRPVIPIWWMRDDGTCACSRAECTSPGKHPILPSWKEFQQRLPSESQVREWWQKWPNANAAMLTGSAGGRSNWVVIDVDRPGASPEFSTRTVRTGGDGLHYYFATKRKWKNSAKGDVHVRGEGGYVLLPTSNHKSGNKYTYIDTRIPAPIERQAIKLLDPDAVFSGNRHDAAGRLIGHLFKEGKSVHEVRKALREWNEEHVYPPLSQAELNRYVDDVATKERAPESAPVSAERFLPMLDFLSFYTPTRQQWLVQDWIPSSSAGIISALPGCYKTWLLLELALSISSGKPFLGSFEVPAPRPVVFCQLEDDFTLLADRLRILLGGCEPTLEGNELVTVFQPNLPIYFYDGRRMDITSPEGMKSLEQVVGDLKAGLLIVDPMNAAVNMEDYGIKAVSSLNKLKEIRDRVGTTLEFSHHDHKSAKESTRQSTYGTVFFDAWKEHGWNITKVAPDTVRIKRHAKLVPYLSDVTVRFVLEHGLFEVEEGT